mmetsp:Transcript_70107/g.193949  ORF Transcript_70107/g.193949 Transcript_70107/m.193949 type:complete len:227 (-) Transcript_70107:957-1637(-)
MRTCSATSAALAAATRLLAWELECVTRAACPICSCWTARASRRATSRTSGAFAASSYTVRMVVPVPRMPVSSRCRPWRPKRRPWLPESTSTCGSWSASSGKRMHTWMMTAEVSLRTAPRRSSSSRNSSSRRGGRGYQHQRQSGSPRPKLASPLSKPLSAQRSFSCRRLCRTLGLRVQCSCSLPAASPPQWASFSWESVTRRCHANTQKWHALLLARWVTPWWASSL